MDIKLILESAPPTPPCFHDRLAWAEYLRSAQSEKVGKAEPFKDGKYQEGFNFCRDCNAQHSQDMHKQGKCIPPVAKPIRSRPSADDPDVQGSIKKTRPPNSRRTSRTEPLETALKDTPLPTPAFPFPLAPSEPATAKDRMGGIAARAIQVAEALEQAAAGLKDLATDIDTAAGEMDTRQEADHKKLEQLKQVKALLDAIPV